MPKLATSLMNEARRVARLQTRTRALRRELKVTEAELRLARKNLRALANATADPFDQAPPLRIFGEVPAALRASGE